MAPTEPPPLSALSLLISDRTQSQDAAAPHFAASHNATDSKVLTEPHVSEPSSQQAPKSRHTALALQILHNLQYQHSWTSLKIHTHSLEAPYRILPRPLLSGLPPTRLYVHPDQQAAEIAEQKVQRARKTGSQETSEETGDAEQIVEQEWVLPTHLREKWSLRQFAEVFDALGAASPSVQSSKPAALASQASSSDATTAETTGNGEQVKRKTQRVLLAMLSGDSTINYYIVHDGIVKPRQN